MPETMSEREQNARDRHKFKSMMGPRKKKK